jgi:hypothetical protein
MMDSEQARRQAETFFKNKNDRRSQAERAREESEARE